MFMNYKPQFYQCELKGLFINENKSYFYLINTKTTLPMLIDVDESKNRIISKMNEVLLGKRDKVYLSFGMRDIDLYLTQEGKWQIFDEFDIYEFKIKDMDLLKFDTLNELKANELKTNEDIDLDLDLE